MQITNAAAAANSPFMRIERRPSVGRCLNQSRAALILPTKLSLRSGRPGMVPPKPPAFCCLRCERSFVGIPRTRPATDSRYDLRIADPPVMIMAVRAAPSSVPATPKREVTKDAAVAARPADMTWFGLTIESALLALTDSESISRPAPFQRPRKIFREEVLMADSMAAKLAVGVEFPQSDQRRAENDGAGRREVYGAFRGDRGLLQQGLLLSGQGTPDHRRNLRFYVRGGGDARRPSRSRRHSRTVRLHLHHPGTRQLRSFER